MHISIQLELESMAQALDSTIGRQAYNCRFKSRAHSYLSVEKFVEVFVSTPIG